MVQKKSMAYSLLTVSSPTPPLGAFIKKTNGSGKCHLQVQNNGERE